jgi:hypothetical protein
MMKSLISMIISQCEKIRPNASIGNRWRRIQACLESDLSGIFFRARVIASQAGRHLVGDYPIAPQPARSDALIAIGEDAPEIFFQSGETAAAHGPLRGRAQRGVGFVGR